MLDLTLHQGTSLYGHAPQDGLRLIAVAGAAQGVAHEALWNLCSHLQRLGYPTVVLDGTQAETAHAPGLHDLLEDSLWTDPPGEVACLADHSLAVLPAERGLAQLAARAPGALDTLQPLLRRYAVVVLYAPIQTLASPLMAQAKTTPLLLLGDDPAAVMASYRDLKLLALHTGLVGTVASVSCGPEARLAAHKPLQVLSKCATKHLGRMPRTLALDASRPADMQRLALELLENAHPLHVPGLLAALPSAHEAPHASPLATSH